MFLTTVVLPVALLTVRLTECTPARPKVMVTEGNELSGNMVTEVVGLVFQRYVVGVLLVKAEKVRDALAHTVEPEVTMVAVGICALAQMGTQSNTTNFKKLFIYTL
jgi:hypothetical protein